jgi:cytochrome c-type biogenesis protein CcmF
MTYLGFGQNLVDLAFGLAVVTFALAITGIAAKNARFIVGARHALFAGGAAAVGAAACLVTGFFRGAYDIRYIFNYSERKLSDEKKFAGLWAGLDGSILFWAAILGVIGAALAWSFVKRGVEPERRRLEPYVYAVFAAVQMFFLGVIGLLAAADPFQALAADKITELTQMGLATGGMPHDGAGLNPLLDTYWMMIHPPCVYLGFILYTVPFAYGAAALLAGEFSTAWIKATRGWTMLAWIFNTNGIILGGLWAYEVLGWGGYWAWDPVENASFLPWLASTAFLHSVMVQERRDMLRTWNAFLICLTFILSIFGTYLTRSGIVSSVHSFAGGEVGTYFLGFLIALIGFTIFLLFFRKRELATGRAVETLFCRESAFILNNFVLLGLAVSITLLVLWPKISFEFLGQGITVGIPVYNRVCTPLFVALYALTAIGPALGWVRTTWTQAVRNLALPAILSVPLTVATQYLVWDGVRGGNQGEAFDDSLHIYPVGVMVFLCWLIITSLSWEVLGTAWRAGKASGRGFLGSLSRLVVMQNRRYGGYIVHCGIAGLGMAVTMSSLYRVQTEVTVEAGKRVPISAGGLYEVEMEKMVVTPAGPGQAYNSLRAVLTLYRGGEVIATLDPEARYWPMTGFRASEDPQNTTEVEVKRLPEQDVYVYFERPGISTAEGPFPPASWFEGQSYRFSVFRNPLMWLLWGGWLTMIVGGVYAALPIGGRKVGLAN